MMLTNRFQLHGDRLRGDDPNTETGLGKVGGMRCCYVLHDEGGFTPAGYGKAAWTLRLAERLGTPVLFLNNAVHLCVSPPEEESFSAHSELMDALAAASVPLIAATDDIELRRRAEAVFGLTAGGAAGEIERAMKEAAAIRKLPRRFALHETT